MSELQKRYTFLLIVTLIIMIVDQWTKHYIHTTFLLSEEKVLIKDYFSITYVRNKGAAFGFLHDAHEAFRKKFFLAIAPLAMGLILYFIKTVENSKLEVFSYSMVFSGALGNYVDRLRYGYVVDFLDIHIERIYEWPVFNVADISIVCGLTGLIWVTLVGVLNSPPKVSPPT